MKKNPEFASSAKRIYKYFMNNNFQEFIKKQVNPELKKVLQIDNEMIIPKIDKVVLNVGVGKSLQDKSYTDHVVKTLQRITGQKPVLTKAKKSISSFKIREGMIVGVKVTLRGKKMYDFVEKLIKVSLPRVRDFRGLSVKSFDRQGNFTLGIKEHLIFPEINPDEVEKIHGLEIVITTTAQDKKEGFWLLKLLGFPFNDEYKDK